MSHKIVEMIRSHAFYYNALVQRQILFLFCIFIASIIIAIEFLSLLLPGMNL
jgi:hypothetical protein